MSSFYKTTISGKCPRCGEGSVFSNPLMLAQSCPVCGLSLENADTADGPAFFVITGVGALVTTLAAAVELIAEPPYWVHAVLWIPLILFLSIVGLRLCKGWMVAAHYRHDFLNSDDS
ncbi:MAG: DUF983 domain-containing protein [Rickettsiales bacterium]